MCEKCRNTEFFLVPIFPYLDWISRFMKCRPEKTPYLDTSHAVSWPCAFINFIWFSPSNFYFYFYCLFLLFFFISIVFLFLFFIFYFYFLFFISNLTLKFGFNSTWNFSFSCTYEKLWRYEKYTRRCRKNCRTSLQKVPSRVRQSEKEFPNSGRRKVSRRNLN